MARGPEPLPRFLDMIDEGLPLGRVKRLDVYAEGYFLRLHDCLAEDFSCVRHALGEERFRRLIAEFLAHFPSTTPNVSEVGRRLPGFALEHRFTCELPLIGDLAALEWALVKSFYAPQAPVFDPALFATLPPEAWTGARFLLAPSALLLESSWPVDAIWRDDTSALDAKPETVRLLIFREGEEVGVDRLEVLPFTILDGMRTGLNLGELTDLAASQGATAEAVQASFGAFVRRGILSNVVLPA
jgi:hypothetical protein